MKKPKKRIRKKDIKKILEDLTGQRTLLDNESLRDVFLRDCRSRFRPSK